LGCFVASKNFIICFYTTKHFTGGKAMRRLTTCIVLSVVLLSLVSIQRVSAQNFTASSASAKFTDRDNNGYANIGDLINLRILADNVNSDSINAAVIFTYYASIDTLYLTRSGGSGPGNTGNGVVFTNPGGNSILERPVGTGLSAKKASASTTPSDGILFYILYKRLQPAPGPGAKQILDTQTKILVGDGVSPVAFRDTIDNERPQIPSTESVALMTALGNPNVANIGDQLKFTVSEAGTGGSLSQVVVFFLAGGNQIQPLVDINQSVLATSNLAVGNPFDGSFITAFAANGYISMAKNGANWESTITLKPGQIDQVANSSTGAYVYVVDQYGNIGSAPIFFGNLVNAIDNKISDLYTIVGSDTTTTANAAQDTLTDLTTDGVSGAYIIGSKVGFKYTEPAGNQNKILSVAMDLSMFGGSNNVPLTFSYVNGGFRVFKTPIQTFTQTTTDAVLSTLRPPITITDSAGNVVKTYAKINVATKVDLVPPGNFSVALNLTTESANANGIGNPNETITASFTGLNQDAQGYRLMANNNHVATSFTAQREDLLTGTFPTTGNIDGGVPQVPTVGAISRTFTLGSYAPTDVPAGLRILANDTTGKITFIVRDDAGNEGTATATMPFAVDNIVPAQPASASVTLQYDADGNGKANIGDSLKVTISGSGPDAALQSVYVYFPSTTYGAIGQQFYTSIDINNNSTQGIANDGNARPDWIKLTKVGSNFVATVPIINDPNSEFTGMSGGAGTLTQTYYIVDANGNPGGGTFTTSALAQSFDNQIPTSTTVNNNLRMTTANANAAAGFGTTYIDVGSTVTLTYLNAPADVDTVWADLRLFGLTANEPLLKATLGVIGNAQKVFIVSAYAGTGVADVASGSDSAKIRILVRDRSNNSNTLLTATVNSISANTGPTILAIDRIKPVAIGQSRVTLIHTDLNNNGVPKPSDNNGIINVGERIRILIDVSNQPDFATLGSVVVDLSAFGLGVQTIIANTAAPAPGTNGYGYDGMENAFVIDQQVANGGFELSAGSPAIIIRNVVDNGGNQTNPTNNPASYTSITVAQRIDAISPIITIPANSFAFSTSSDINGDGIAAIGDGVQINADVVGADSVFADLRVIGRAITPMVKVVGNSYSIASISVLQANDPQFASDDAQGTTAIQIIAQDNAGNRAVATTVAMNVDNLPVNAPVLSASSTTGGRIALRIEDGPNAIERRTYPNATLTFNSDMTGGLVPGTTLYQVFYDSLGTGAFVLASTVPYSAGFTTFTSQPFSDGRIVSFKVTPFDNAGNPGTQSLAATTVARVNPSPAVTYEPPNGTIIGSVTATTLRAIIDTTRMNLVTAVTFRARAADIDSLTAGKQPGTWFTVGGAAQTADVWSLNVNAGSFIGSPAVGYAYQVIARVTDAAGNVQTDDQALAANGSITVYADAVNPSIRLIAINDSTFGGIDPTPPPAFVDVKARGITTFKYQITDNLTLNQSVARLQVRMDPTGGSGFFVLVSNQTIADYIAAGYLTVNSNVYALRLDLTPYVGNNPIIEVTIQDGHDNQAVVTQRFSVDDKVPPAFYLREPFPSTSFKNTLRVVLTATGVGNSAIMSEAMIQLSATANFAAPIQIGTVTTQFLTTLTIPSSVTLLNNTTYYVRAIVKDANGNSFTTDANAVLYTANAPTLVVTFPQSITVSGVGRIAGVSKVVVQSAATNIASILVRSRRIDQDASTFVPSGALGTISQAPFEYSFSTATNYGGYEGYVVLEVTPTDNAGNSFPPQYVTVFVDNKQPSYRITAVNGDSEIGSFAPMVAGDTMRVQVAVIDNDVATGQFMISNFNSSIGAVTVLGISTRSGNIFSVKFPLPSAAANNNVNMDPTAGFPRIAVVLTDSVGNNPGAYVGPLFGGSPGIGAVTVMGNQNPTAFLSNVQRGFSLKGFVTINTRTFGMSSVGGSVRFELRRPGATAFDVLGTDNSEPFQTNINTPNYTDGAYLLRAIPIAANGVEYAPDTLTVVFDNSNNGTTERATIVSLGGARIGGTSLTFRANAGTSVGAVQFQSRFGTGINGGGGTSAGWTTLGKSSVRNPDGTFGLTLSALEIANAYGVTVANLDGEHEIRAVAEDQAGYQFYALNNPGNAIPLGTGNTDDPAEVATTRAVIDVTAPNGTFALAGVQLTATQQQTFGAANQQNFNLRDGVDTIAVGVTSGVSDFGVAEVTLLRFASRKPGTGGPSQYGDGLGEGAEKVVATYTNPGNIVYVLNSTTLVRGGLYRIRVNLKDNLGNLRNIQQFDFIAGNPKVSVAGYNQEHRVLYLVGQAHASSAKVEYSLDNGTNWRTVETIDLNQIGTGTNLDAAQTNSVSLQNIALPAGTVLFRATGSEQSAANFGQSRFALSPTVFSMTVAANGAWTPTNIATSGISLFLNKQAGDLTNIRPEITPENPNDPVTLLTVIDNNPNVSTSGLFNDVFPRNVNSANSFFAQQVLQGIDATRLGLTNGLNLTTTINGGGEFDAFVTNVRGNGTVDMTLQSTIVKRVAADRGDTVNSTNGNFSIRFAGNTLTGNVGILIEEDVSKFRSYAANQLDIGQIGSGYWFRGLNGALRSGFRATVIMKFPTAEIVDANKDGVIDGRDKLMLNVATITGTSFNFTGDIKDKSVDTVNNTVTFTITSMNLDRYALVLANAVNAQQGSIIVSDIRVGNTRSNNYTTFNGATFTAIVGDNLSGINTSTPMLFVNDVRVQLFASLLAGVTNSYRFTASLTGLNLIEGPQRGRFVVENNNGNRFDRSFTFNIDQTPPRVVQQTALFGKLKNQAITFTLVDPAAGINTGSGVDTLTVFVDVYGTKAVRKDSSELAYEIQQFIARLNPSQLTFSTNLDSLKVSFVLVDNLDKANIDGYELVVHDGTTSLSMLLNSNIIGTGSLVGYGQSGIWDLAGNESFPINFRVAEDATGPTVTVLSKKVEGSGIKLSVVDNQSGVDTTSIQMIEINSDTKDSTFAVLGKSSALTYANGVLTYTGAKPGDVLVLKASDAFANTTTFTMFAESDALVIRDFHIYPNPFNPEARNANITFSLSSAANVTIEAFDWLGRSAGSVIERQLFTAGRPANLLFTGRLPDGTVLANGVYFLKMTVHDGTKISSSIFKAVIAVKR
jgi:hypothetical protein